MWLSLIKVEFESSRYNKTCFTKKMRNDTFRYSQFSFYEKPLFEWKNSQEPKIIGVIEKVEKIACLLHFEHPKSD